MDGKIYTPFELGKIAFKQNFPMSTNPYKVGCWEYNDWVAGYLGAKATADHKNRQAI